jgi:hypothetical protein
MDRGKQKSGSRYFLDRGLIQRVSELVSAGVIHPDNICEQLRQKYPAVYGRKPYAALKVSIDKGTVFARLQVVRVLAPHV